MAWPADGVPSAAELVEHATTTGRRFTELLPPSLRSGSRWALAGAVAGAASCAAAAVLVAPVAISGLPVWTAFGAGLSGVVAAARGARDDTDDAVTEGSDAPDLETADAVRAAALFAVLLAAQPYDESAISRLLDATFADAPECTVRAGDGAACRAWLAEITHRYDLACAAEGRRDD